MFEPGVIAVMPEVTTGTALPFPYPSLRSLPAPPFTLRDHTDGSARRYARPRAGRPRAYRSAAAMIFCATGAARPFPLTSERGPPASSMTTATAICFPVSRSVP